MSFLTLIPLMSVFLLQSDDDLAAALGGVVGSLCSLALALVIIIALWVLFQKAGKPGWAAIIPFYNIWVLLEVVGRPGWWLLLYFIPFVNIIIGFILMFDLAKAFGKEGGFAIGLILLPIIFLPILAFGDAQYVGPVAAG